jgi:3-hydroxypropanoate dehydrogenase
MPVIDDACLDVLFRNARTQNGYLDKPVPDELLKQIYDVARMGPTTMNSQPMRIVFLRTQAAKERLIPVLSSGNVAKVRQAPVTALIAMDMQFYEHMPTIWHTPDGRAAFAGKPAHFIETVTLRNGSLQGAYFMIVARGMGLDCGPMSGFDLAKANAEFFPDGRFRSNFLCTLGYGDPSKIFDRNRRLEFDEACTLL